MNPSGYRLALQVYYRKVDKLLKAGLYGELDTLLAKTVPDNANENIVLTLLTLSYRDRNRYVHRNHLLTSYSDWLTANNRNVAEMLHGLT